MPRNFPAAVGQPAPTSVGSRPLSLRGSPGPYTGLGRRGVRALGPLGVAVAATLAVVACSQGSNNQTTAPVDLGMTSTMTPYYSSQQLTLYEAQTAVALPVRAPSSSESSSLGPTPAGTGYPHAPYLTADDESLEVHFILSNIDTTDHTVWMLVDPWNEFVRYNPGIAVVNDEESVPNFGYDVPFLVKALSRVEGTLTPDDMHEIAIKLASVENELGSPQAIAAASAGAGSAAGMAANAFNATGIANNIMNPQNRSNGGDPIYTPWIPPVIAGLTGFDLGLRTTEAANIAIEITIDIQDLNGNRFVASDSSKAQIGVPPATLSPAGARF